MSHAEYKKSVKSLTLLSKQASRTLGTRPTPSTTISSLNNSRQLLQVGRHRANIHAGQTEPMRDASLQRQPSKGILKKSTVYDNSSSSSGGFTAEMVKARNKLGQTKSISFLDLKLKENNHEEMKSKLLDVKQEC